MTKQELIIKFSNENYSTKKEVANDMKTPLIDNIWNDIKGYRSNFNINLNLKHITNSDYIVCLTPNINQKINSIERKLMNINFNYLKLSLSKSDYLYKKEAYEKIIREFTKNYNIHIEDFEIQKILINDLNNLRPELVIVENYYSCLESLNNYAFEHLNLNTLENFAKKMLCTDNVELRKTEIQNELTKVLINKIYAGLPVNSISKSLDNLIDFVNNDEINVLIRSISSIYYIYYVRPYDAYSEDLAIYFAKAILIHSGFEFAATLDLESIILDDKEGFKTHFIESQKELDLTYFINYCLKKFEKIIDNANLFLNNAKSKVITNELYADEVKSTDLVPDLNDLEALSSENDRSEIKLQEDKASVNFSQNIAIENISIGLTEQEAQKLERHLLEMEPSLSRGQAYFYARHCTLNMNYTISQYKKDVGCAYETARSSMDNLVRLGYYKKELLKNKFVYIPIKRR